MRYLFLVTGLLLLMITEVLSAYSIMPVTDRQEKDNLLAVTYFFHHNIIWLRIVAVALITYAVFYILKHGKLWLKLLLIPAFAGYVLLFYYFNFYLSAIEIYQPMQVKTFASREQNVITNNKLVAPYADLYFQPPLIQQYKSATQGTILEEPLLVF